MLRPPTKARCRGANRRLRLSRKVWDMTAILQGAQRISGRSSSREMMWRWISEVPSQMRSIRALRQMRSTGPSSIRPMPP